MLVCSLYTLRLSVDRPYFVWVRLAVKGVLTSKR